MDDTQHELSRAERFGKRRLFARCTAISTKKHERNRSSEKSPSVKKRMGIFFVKKGIICYTDEETNKYLLYQTLWSPKKYEIMPQYPIFFSDGFFCLRRIIQILRIPLSNSMQRLQPKDMYSFSWPISSTRTS